jgi:1,4-dihydroxy-6-naphthoate synthase
MNIAFSPCPNDTFTFHAWVNGLINGAPELHVTYADIDKTNYWAMAHKGPEIMKISYAALPYVLSDYQLIPCGGALGRGCGPLVLTKGNDNAANLSEKTVAVPSDKSTAFMLFTLWAAQNVPHGIGKVVVLPFNEIMPAVKTGKVDAGLVIHEARFTYKQYDLTMMVDLGDWWEEDTGLPIPLGAIIAKRSLGKKEEITEWIRRSVEYAWKHPEASMDYVMAHADEMSVDVAKSHIDLYVNEFTEKLGEDGYAAIESLLSRAAAEGVVPQCDLARLRD